MKITNYRKVGISSYLTALIDDSDRICLQSSENWQIQSVLISFDELQTLINVVQGKKLEDEIQDNQRRLP